MGKESYRCCLACRERERKEVLLRFVLKRGGIVWDKEKNLPGRGAYLHKERDCLQKVSERRLWERAFRVRESVPKQEDLLRFRQELIAELRLQLS